MIINLKNDYSIQIQLSARHKWTHFKIHKYENYSHLVWGKLSVIYGYPACSECKDTTEVLESIQVINGVTREVWVNCQECCPHDDHDHGICLDCEKDLNYTLIDRAESMYESER